MGFYLNFRTFYFAVTLDYRLIAALLYLIPR
jgi:hypothetical protein